MGIESNDNNCDNIYNVDVSFSFEDDMPTFNELVKIIRDIDVSKSSCVQNINSNFCKYLMIAIPDIVLAIYTKSLVTGKIPTDWTKGTITVILNDGDLTDPGNWRQITQTSIFAKVLEKLVLTRLLNYLLSNNIISEYQFGFLPGRSTQLAVFELTEQIYSSMNNKKIF